MVTVAELIEIMKTFPQDYMVHLNGYDGKSGEPIVSRTLIIVGKGK